MKLNILVCLGHSCYIHVKKTERLALSAETVSVGRRWKRAAQEGLRRIQVIAALKNYIVLIFAFFTALTAYTYLTIFDLFR